MKKQSNAKKHKKKTSAPKGGHWIGAAEFSRLQDNLHEAQETLKAIRNGEVDAVVVKGPHGDKVYSLTSVEQPYRVYVEQMQEGAVTVSSDGIILYSNQRFADMLQVPLERIISSQFSTCFEAGAWHRISRVFKEGNVAKYNCNLVPRTGGKMPVNLTASRFLLENQNVMCLVVTDLTEQKKLEEVRMARELAEKASVAKDDFLAALSHELRTPLTPVLMATSALEQMKGLSSEIRDSLRLIRRNVEVEARLIDDLLDLTRIAHGKMEVQLRETDFHSIINRALDICRPEFKTKSHKIILDLNAKVHHGDADAVRIQQAIWNLVRNAAKFTPERGAITVRTTNRNHGHISIEIQDTGMGFEAGAAEKLFEPFEQGGRHITRQFGGLGLGLAITRSIVEAHGGTIKALSDGIGKGATLMFEIPCRVVRTVAVETDLVSTSMTKGVRGQRILLVEDHEDTRVTLASLLQRHKHTVKVASSANEALKLAAEHDFDLVISDIGLPDQSGLSLMERLRDQFGLKGIGLSGYGMAEDVAKGLQAGFVRHLTKPVRFDRLTEAIAEVNVSAK